MAHLVRRMRDENLGGPGVRWDPFEMMRELMSWDPFREIAAGGGPSEGLAFHPRFEVKENKEAYVLKADLPGVDENDVDITLSGNRITISGKREAEAQKENETYYTYERSYGQFSRSFTLPEGVDAERIEAEMKNGVLTIQLPKRPELQSKKITLKGVVGRAVDKVKGTLGGKETGKPSA